MIMTVLKFIFGTNPKQIFKRVITLVIIIGIILMFLINVGCGIRDGKFWFEWKPANVSIDYKKGQ